MLRLKKIQQKEEEQIYIRHDVLKSNKKAENKIFGYPNLGLEEDDWAKLPIKAFSAPLLEELTSFVVV